MLNERRVSVNLPKEVVEVIETSHKKSPRLGIEVGSRVIIDETPEGEITRIVVKPSQDPSDKSGKVKVTVGLSQEVVDQIESFHQAEVKRVEEMGLTWNEYITRYARFK